jgi:hypothetical protein
MKTTEKDDIKFTVTDKLKARALELLDESQAMQFAEGLRLSSAAKVVFDREQRRLEKKYGKDDQRTKDMSLRAEASATAKTDLFSRYTDAIVRPAKPKEGWSIDGFVRGPDGRGLEGLTVAAYDKQENQVKEFGQATTDEKGYFSITVEKLPEKPPKQVLMRATLRQTLLPSNDVTVSPESGGVERVEIIVRVKDKEPKPDKPTDKTPDKPTDKTPDKPTDKTPDKPTDKTPDRPIDKTPDKPTDKTPDKPIDKTPDKPTDKTPDKPIDKTPDRPIDKPDRPIDKTPDKPIDRTPDKPIVVRPKPTAEPAEDPTVKLSASKSETAKRKSSKKK